MFKKFFFLEWKSFIRSASFKANMVLKVFMALGALYFIGMFLLLGFGAYFILEKFELEPFATVNRFLMYYLLMDLLIRFFLQKMPVMNVRQLLTLPISKSTIVKYTLGKTILSYFNWLHLFFLLPFSVVLMIEGFEVTNVLAWFFSVFVLIFFNNFINILINNRDWLLYTMGALLIATVSLHYFGVLDPTLFAGPVFQSLYDQPYLIVLPLLLLAVVMGLTYRFFFSRLYLDSGLSIKQQDAKTEQLTWLDRFGLMGTFLKNDIKLLRRNKRSKTTLLISLLFVFYGLLFFTGAVEAYEGPVWRIFAGLFVTGGFLFTFGQFVPSWDSAYYPLMMSQNIRYRDYLNSKWWLMVVATTVTTLLSSFYLYFGWEVYLAIIVGAIYNIGVNAHVVLWAGAYVKTPIDLTQNKNVFGDKQAFNIKSMLLALPKLLLPMLFYAIGHYAHSPELGYLIVALAGILGFAFKEKVFTIIESIYKSEKYKTIAAYSEN
ncbi:DUF5687 family protein [uncultured Planktosalinus sp.]|uniref:DUF5687 family protein n=1 Tax=uncultured Planktosalinus sp. TaxID=1810935 RepID=UPI0030D6E271